MNQYQNKEALNDHLWNRNPLEPYFENLGSYISPYGENKSEENRTSDEMWNNLKRKLRLDFCLKPVQWLKKIYTVYTN